MALVDAEKSVLLLIFDFLLVSFANNELSIVFIIEIPIYLNYCLKVK